MVSHLLPFYLFYEIHGLLISKCKLNTRVQARQKIFVVSMLYYVFHLLEHMENCQIRSRLLKMYCNETTRAAESLFMELMMLGKQEVL